MIDNVIPYIGGEEEKSEREPLKIWGEIKDGAIVPAASPEFTAQCIRVPVTDGHTAAVFVDLIKNLQKRKYLKSGIHSRAELRSSSFQALQSSFFTILPRTICLR